MFIWWYNANWVNSRSFILFFFHFIRSCAHNEHIRSYEYVKASVQVCYQGIWVQQVANTSTNHKYKWAKSIRSISNHVNQLRKETVIYTIFIWKCICTTSWQRIARMCEQVCELCAIFFCVAQFNSGANCANFHNRKCVQTVRCAFARLRLCTLPTLMWTCIYSYEYFCRIRFFLTHFMFFVWLASIFFSQFFLLMHGTFFHHTNWVIISVAKEYQIDWFNNWFYL